jgi:CysZ protein
MTGSPITGAGYLFQGFALIRQPGIRRLVAVPLFINTVLFSLLIWYGASQFAELIEWLLPEWLDWLRWLLWPFFAVSMLLVLFYTFTLVANLIGAPFNGLLAEAVERRLTGNQPPKQGGWQAILQGVIPSIVSEFKKLFYFLTRAIPLLLLFLIPGINLAAPFLWMAFTAWMLALEYADYPMSNHGLLFSQQRLKLKEKPLLVFGFGGATLFLTLIPIVNFLVMPTAVAGATALWVQEFSKKSD